MIDKYFGDKQGFYWVVLLAVALQLCSTIVAIALFGWQRPSSMSWSKLVVNQFYGQYSWSFITGVMTALIVALHDGAPWPGWKWLSERAGLTLESTVVVALVTVLPMLTMLAFDKGGAASVIEVLLPVVAVVMWVITAFAYIVFPFTAAVAASRKLHIRPALVASVSDALSKPGFRTLGLAALLWLAWFVVARVESSDKPLLAVCGSVAYAALSLVFAASVAKATRMNDQNNLVIE